MLLRITVACAFFNAQVSGVRDSSDSDLTLSHSGAVSASENSSIAVSAGMHLKRTLATIAGSFWNTEVPSECDPKDLLKKISMWDDVEKTNAEGIKQAEERCVQQGKCHMNGVAEIPLVQSQALAQDCIKNGGVYRLINIDYENVNFESGSGKRVIEASSKPFRVVCYPAACSDAQAEASLWCSPLKVSDKKNGDYSFACKPSFSAFEASPKKEKKKSGAGPLGTNWYVMITASVFSAFVSPC